MINLLKNYSLILRMARKEISDRYAGSAFGLLWTIIQPLFLIAVYTLVFTFVFNVRLGPNDPPVRYAIYALTGLIPWIALSEGLTRSISSISSKAALVKQTIFPVEILPISTVISSFLTLIIGLIISLILVFTFIPDQINWYLILLPLIIFLQFIFMIGIAYFLSISGVYFKDTNEIVILLLTVGMFITPILYIESMVPKIFQIPMNLNPLAHLIYIYRDLLFYGKINHPWSFVIFGILSIIVFLLGFLFFKKVKHQFSNVL